MNVARILPWIFLPLEIKGAQSMNRIGYERENWNASRTSLNVLKYTFNFNVKWKGDLRIFNRKCTGTVNNGHNINLGDAPLMHERMQSWGEWMLHRYCHGVSIHPSTGGPKELKRWIEQRLRKREYWNAFGINENLLLLLLRERILHEGEKVVKLKLLPLPLLLTLAASQVSFTRPKREKLCGYMRTEAVVLPTANVLGAAIASLSHSSPHLEAPSPRQILAILLPLTSTHNNPIPRNVQVSKVANTHKCISFFKTKCRWWCKHTYITMRRPNCHSDRIQLPNSEIKHTDDPAMMNKPCRKSWAPSNQDTLDHPWIPSHLCNPHLITATHRI